MNEKRKANVMFNKNGNGYLTTRIAIPGKWIKKIGFTQENREAIITISDNNKIIIEKST